MRIGVDIDSLGQRQDADAGSICVISAVWYSESVSAARSEGVRYLLREAHKRGAKTVMITAQNKDSYAEYCSEVLLLPSLRASESRKCDLAAISDSCHAGFYLFLLCRAG